MATTARHQPSDLIKELLQHGQGYSFFQALRLLEADSSDNSTQMRSVAELSFPATDIKACHLNKQGSLVLYLTFMGLYGVDSPLPHYFLEQTLGDESSAKCTRAFLDIFNNHCYRLLYLAWKKYHPLMHVKQRSAYLEYLKSISGNLLTKKDTTEYGVTGILGARIHNSSGLAGLLREYLEIDKIFVHQFMPRWIKVGAALPLGQTAINLGDNTLLGNQVVSLMQEIAICFGPITFLRAQQLLPGQPKYALLKSLIQRYVGTAILFTLVITIYAPTAKIIRLGQDQAQLGWASWLGVLQQDIYEIKV
ncbi:MAG: type VI secretion system baseplate subunit TssG [Gammaproteobacteria bacterium]|nr:type VI secretion system baseplate subunit TssG [Gammaproteobacteria bacterium]